MERVHDRDAEPATHLPDRSRRADERARVHDVRSRGGDRRIESAHGARVELPQAIAHAALGARAPVVGVQRGDRVEPTVVLARERRQQADRGAVVGEAAREIRDVPLGSADRRVGAERAGKQDSHGRS